MTKKIRGVTFEENLDNSMGLEFYNLSHRFGYQSPNWPYFEDVKIERIHYHAKSGVAFDREEHSLGICAAGVVMRDPLGNDLAISVPVPAQRFYAQEKLIAERLLATRRALDEQLAAAA